MSDNATQPLAEPTSVIALVGLPEGTHVRGPLYQCWRCPALLEWRDGAWYQRGDGSDRCHRSPTGWHECAPEKEGFHGWSHATGIREVTHMCPGDGDGGLMPCCEQTPFEAPRTDRMTAHPEMVTCRREAERDG